MSAVIPPTGRSGRWPLVGLILAVSMTTIDQTIVALSAPTIQDRLGLSHSAMQWAVNAYLLGMAAFFLLGGRVADVVGHRRMVLIGTAAFAVMSLVCGLTPAGDIAAPWLIMARVLQGIAGAFMFPAALGLVVQTFPASGRGKAMAAFFAISGATTAVGPIFGGLLTQWTWRAIFWINLPIAAVALVVIAVTSATSSRARERIDWTGAALVAVGMALVVLGLQQAASWGWADARTVASIAGGAVVLVAFALVELRTAVPLVRLRAFRDRGFTVSMLATLVASVAFIPSFFFLSVYGQVSQGMDASSTGWLLGIFFVGFVVASRRGASLFDRAGARPVIAIGGVLGVLGFGGLALVLTRLHPGGSILLSAQTVPLLIAGAGVGFMFSAVSTDALNRAGSSSYGEVTAVSQTMKNFGGALGLAVLSTLVTTQLTHRLTTSFLALGGTADDAAGAVDQVTGASSGGSALTGVPAAVRAQVMAAVQSDYAHAAQWAFGGMAVAMAVLALLAAVHPGVTTAGTAVAAPAGSGEASEADRDDERATVQG